MTYEEQLRARLEAVADRLRDGLLRDLDETLGGPPPQAVDLERLLKAVRLFDRARSLTEILDTLVDCATREAPRVTLLIVEGDRLRSWRLSSFGPQVEPTDTFEGTSGLIAQAIRSRVPVFGRTAAEDPVGPFAGLRDGSEVLAVPLVLGGEVVAVLYAARDGQSGGTEAVMLELLARHAARALESVTACRTAQLSAARLTQTLAAREQGSSDARQEPTGEQSARRYARLLISEIKLYHEAEVAAGCQEGNLRTRLGEEIAQAYTLYRERIPEQLDRMSNIFESELIRTLAGGDAALLGA